MATTATMSGPQFDALPYEEGRRWELLEGDLIEVSSPTPRHQFALSDLLRLRPDICVLLGERARQLDPDRTPLPGAPDLAIEVISPMERASESHEKVRA